MFQHTQNGLDKRNANLPSRHGTGEGEHKEDSVPTSYLLERTWCCHKNVQANPNQASALKKRRRQHAQKLRMRATRRYGADVEQVFMLSSTMGVMTSMGEFFR